MSESENELEAYAGELAKPGGGLAAYLFSFSPGGLAILSTFFLLTRSQGTES